MPQPEGLQRFVTAQAPVYRAALAELRAGQKHGHWMWFIFPQLRGLGHSPTAILYGIASRAEAAEYAQHRLLAARLRECTEAVLQWGGTSARQIFGTPDDLKLRSSLTLFAAVSGDPQLFERALDAFFAGVPDPKTLLLLARSTAEAP